MDQVVPVCQVHNPGQGVGRFKTVPMHAHTRGGGQFSLDGVVFQRDGVITCMPAFRGFLKPAFVFVSPTVALSKLGARHDQHIAVVADPSALKMGVAEAVNHAVCVVVTTASVPSFQPGVGAELNHPKGRRGPWVGVAVSSRANPRVHFKVQGLDVGAARRQRDSGQRQPGEASDKLTKSHSSEGLGLTQTSQSIRLWRPKCNTLGRAGASSALNFTFKLSGNRLRMLS